MFGSLGTTELIIILIIVVLIFGVGRVSKIGAELGQGIREFRRGIADGTEEDAEETQEE